MADVLSTLLSRSWAFYKANFVAILLGAIVMGAVTLVLQLTVMQQVNQGMGQLGIDTNRLEDLQRRAQAGDQQAAQDLQNEVQQAVGNLGANGDVASAVGSAAKNAMWTFFIMMIVSVVLGVLFNGYILLLVLEKQTPQMALAKLGALFIPLIGLSVWLVICSFVWVPLIGIFIAIVIGPRFVLAPIYLVRDKKGVMESAKLSYAQTKGFWGKIVGNSIVAGICAGVVAWAVDAILRMVLSGLALYLVPFVSALATGFMLVFAVYLGLALLQGHSTPAPMSSAPPVAPVS